MSDVFNALSSPVRREILALLKARDMTAGELAERLSVGRSTLSGHFNVLKAADLVTTTRQGTTITYHLNTSVVEELLGMIVGLFASNEKQSDEKQQEQQEEPAP